MIRGKIVFIDNNRRIYSTVEFNGYLYPNQKKGYGREIVTHFQYGGFKDVYAFERFVVKFDNKYIIYSNTLAIR